MLESDPVKGDLVHEFMAMKFMNRTPIAHLSIERALKYLISAAGGEPTWVHELKDLYKELHRLDPTSSEFLEEIFQTAVLHYRYNPNVTGQKHLKTLENYFESAGSEETFQAMRYWELQQSTDEAPLRQVSLPLHIELLHGLSELLLAPTRPKDTVASRVERAVSRAMTDHAGLGFATGSPEENSVRAYITWLQGFSRRSDALTEAVQKGFSLGDDFISSATRKAYETLRGDPDPAISYFASTLDVLPLQPRDVVPCVEWKGPEEYRFGAVTSPAGTPLGIIERGPDKLWYITPRLAGRVSAKANTQTDARSYLAAIQSSPVKVTVGGEVRSLRLVGEEHSLYEQNFDEVQKRFEGSGDDTIWTHKVVFWDKDHGIKLNAIIELEVRPRDMTNSVHKLAGRVTEVAEHEVYLSGDELFDLAEKAPD